MTALVRRVVASGMVNTCAVRIGRTALAVTATVIWLGTAAGSVAANAWTNLGAGVDDNVSALASDGTYLYAGGAFSMAGGVIANRMAGWDGAAWTNLGDGLDNNVNALVHDGSRLYAAGRFTTAAGVPVGLVAQWDGSAWSAVGGGVSGYQIYAMVRNGADLYVAGDFTNAGGVTVVNIAKWNGTTWTNLGSGIQGGYGLGALAHDGVNLYAAGSYVTNAGGVTINNIAMWNGATWTNLGTGVDGWWVATLAHDGRNLYVGGMITNAGGVTVNNVAQWDGTAWAALGAGVGTGFESVGTLLCDGPYLYAGGAFTTAGGAGANNIAVWDGDTWTNLDSGMNNAVNALGLGGTNLFAGGTFTEAGGISANRVATRTALPKYGAMVLSASQVVIRTRYQLGSSRLAMLQVSNAGAAAFAYTTETRYPGPAFLSTFNGTGTVAAGGQAWYGVAMTNWSLEPGTYYATNVITSPEATNSPQLVSVRLEIGQGWDTIFFSNTNQAYDGNPKAVTAVSQHTNPVTVTYNGSATPPSALGAYAVTGVVNTVNWTSINRTVLTIARMPQAITNYAPADGTLFITNDLAQLRGQGGGSGNPVVYTLAPGGVGTLTGGTNLSFSGPGTVTVYANQAGDTFYDPAATVTLTYYIYPNIAYTAPSGNDAAIGRTWATAKRTIQAALDISRPGGAVWVSNGLYNVGGGILMGGATNRVAITNNISVRSVNGPLFTTIAGAGGVRPVAIETGLLAGFTLTSGAVVNAWGGGFAGMGADAVVTNCIISGNQAVSGGGVSGGTVYNSQLLGNYVTDSGGGGMVSHLVRCNLTGNQAGRNGGGVRWSTVDSCSIMYNAAQGLSGGGVNESVANNCLIVGNSAGFFGGAAVYTPLVNCTIYANGTGVSGGSLVNCVAWGNGIGDIYGLENINVRNSCLGFVNTQYRDFGVRTGVNGNIIGNALFADPANGDFRLQAASPCIDAGDNALVPTNLVADLAGNPRISGLRVDMGAYEYPLNVYYAARNGQTPVVPYASWSNAAANIPSLVVAATGVNDRVFFLGQGLYAEACTLTADNPLGATPGHLSIAPTGTVVAPYTALVGSNQSYVAFRGTRAYTQVVNRIALRQNLGLAMARAARRPISAGVDHTVAFKRDGAVVAWGDNSEGQCNVPPDQYFTAIQACARASAGLTVQGALAVWGHAAMFPLPVPNTGFADLYGGADATCMIGLKTDGSLAVWGSPQAGQENVPAPNNRFAAAAAGGNFCLGLKIDGTVVAWGSDGYGQCRVPSPNSGFVAVAAGSMHGLGLKTNGSIVGWGYNVVGQATPPSPNSGFVAIAAGGEHSLALKSDGTIVAWGYNQFGECNVPAPNTNFVAIAAGGNHSVGLKSDGTIVAWGASANGQCNVPPPNSGFGMTAVTEPLGLLVDGCRVWATNAVDLATSFYMTDLARATPALTVQNCGVLRTPNLSNRYPLRILNNGLLEWIGVDWWTNSTRRQAVTTVAPAPGGVLWAQGYANFEEGELSASSAPDASNAVVSVLQLTNGLSLVGGTTIGVTAGAVGGHLLVRGDATGLVASTVSSRVATNGDRWEAAVALAVSNAVIGSGADFDFSSGLALNGDARLALQIAASGYLDGTNGGLRDNQLLIDQLVMPAGSSILVGTNPNQRITLQLGAETELAGRTREITDTRPGQDVQTIRHAYAVRQGGGSLGLAMGSFFLSAGDRLVITSMTYDIETDLVTGLSESLARVQLSDGSVLELYQDETGAILPNFVPGPGDSSVLDSRTEGGMLYITVHEKLGSLQIGQYTVGLQTTYGFAGTVTSTVTFFNTSTVAGVTYAITNAAAWLALAPQGGTLAPTNAVAVRFSGQGTGLDAGAHVTTATVTASEAPGRLSYITVTMQVARAGQAITQFAPASGSRFMAGQAIALSAAGGGSGNPVVFTNLNLSGQWTAADTFVPAVPGVLRMTASQAGNSNYFGAATLTNSYMIISASQGWLLLLLEE